MSEEMKLSAGQSITKKEEMDMLHNFVSKIAKGSYLDTLFTPELLFWIEIRIKDDWSLDIHEELLSQNKRLWEIGDQLHDEMYNHKNQIQTYKDLVTSKQGVIDELQKKVKNLEDYQHELYEEGEKWLRERNQFADEIMSIKKAWAFLESKLTEKEYNQ